MNTTDSKVLGWAFNSFVETADCNPILKDFRAFDAVGLREIRTMITRMEFTPVNVEDVSLSHLIDAMTWCGGHTDGSVWPMQEINRTMTRLLQLIDDATITGTTVQTIYGPSELSGSSLATIRPAPRRKFVKFSSNHDRSSCPQLKSLRLSHAVACDFNHFSEEN